jgi:hypothetical protein
VSESRILSARFEAEEVAAIEAAARDRSISSVLRAAVHSAIREQEPAAARVTPQSAGSFSSLLVREDLDRALRLAEKAASAAQEAVERAREYRETLTRDEPVSAPPVAPAEPEMILLHEGADVASSFGISRSRLRLLLSELELREFESWPVDRRDAAWAVFENATFSSPLRSLKGTVPAGDFWSWVEADATPAEREVFRDALLSGREKEGEHGTGRKRGA